MSDDNESATPRPADLDELLKALAQRIKEEKGGGK
jgi:hypothetical protein